MMMPDILYIAVVLLTAAGGICSIPIIRHRSYRSAGILLAAGSIFLMFVNSAFHFGKFSEITASSTQTIFIVFISFCSVLFSTLVFIIAGHSRSIGDEQKRLKEGLEKYHSIFANSNESFLLFMVKDEALGGTFIDANNAACDLLGYSANEIRSLSIDDIIIRSSFSSISEIKEVLLSQNLNIFQMQARMKSGVAIPVEISFHAYSLRGENYILMIMRDITERFLSEQKINIALKEKEVMLYEIHHRVKNNLQIISSLLDMVSMRVRDNNALNFLKDLESKIYTMSLLHTHLYKHERFDSINIGECFREIIQHLGRLYNTENICIHIECPDIFIPINTAIPVCLVINEALSNATRHAFTGIGKDRMCAIWICSSLNPEEKIILSVRDNGIGFPEKIDSDTTSSIGIKLMRTIVHDQLKGSFSIQNINGTEIVIQFSCSHCDPPV